MDPIRGVNRVPRAGWHVPRYSEGVRKLHAFSGMPVSPGDPLVPSPANAPYHSQAIMSADRSGDLVSRSRRTTPSEYRGTCHPSRDVPPVARGAKLWEWLWRRCCGRVFGGQETRAEREPATSASSFLGGFGLA